MYVTAMILARVESRGWIGPGLTGFLVIMALVVAVVVLYKSMNKQLKKVTFDDGATPTDPTDGPAESSGTDAESAGSDQEAADQEPVDQESNGSAEQEPAAGDSEAVVEDRRERSGGQA